MFLFRKLSGISGFSTARQDDSNISSHDEDDVSKQALDQASEYIREGDYEEALWMLERLGQLDPAVKGMAELAAVADVCNAAILRTCACTRESKNPDWYKVLKVDEKSEPSAIKKRYRHLALLLHPDKNKHVKAEAAFKLVSEAYACLSDKKKREIFNVRKSLTKCKHCSSRDCASSGSDRWSDYDVVREKTSLRRPGSSPDLTQVDWILDQERLKVFRARARARVFGNLEKAWKGRGFTGLDTSVVKGGFNTNPKDKVRMNTNRHESKRRTSEINQEKGETLTDSFVFVGDKGLGSEEDRMDAGKHKKVSHHQLYQPCKNLGALIRDLQAELISSTESKDELEDAANQKSTSENNQRPDAEGSETSVHGMLDEMSGAYIQEISMDHSPGMLRAVSYNQDASPRQRSFFAVGNQKPPSSAENDSPATNGDTPLQNHFVSKQSFDKGFRSDKRKEHESKSGESEKDSALGCQPMQESERKDSSGNERKGFQRDDSLEMEETILRTQREKSEQLLKTLQRLREETRTVAASLNHLRSGCS